jgi:ribosomal protein L37AE/L43A
MDVVCPACQKVTPIDTDNDLTVCSHCGWNLTKDLHGTLFTTHHFHPDPEVREAAERELKARDRRSEERYKPRGAP